MAKHLSLADKPLASFLDDTNNLYQMIYSHTIPLAHLVPANTSPGSGISSPRYTCVPRHRIRPPSCRGMFVSIETALVPITGLLAPPWHWIFPHLASLFKSHRQNTMSEHATTVLNVLHWINGIRWQNVCKKERRLYCLEVILTFTPSYTSVRSRECN